MNNPCTPPRTMSFQLSPASYDVVRRAAAERGVSASDMIRNALADLLKTEVKAR